MRLESLRARLLVWTVVPLAAAIGLNLFLTWQHAKVTAEAVNRRVLVASARAIAEQLLVVDGLLDAAVPPVSLEMFDTGDGDRVFYAVRTHAGRLVTGYPDLPPPWRAGTASPFYYTSEFQGARLLDVTITQTVAGAGAQSPARIIVGVTRRSEYAMEQRLWREALWQQSLLLVIASGVVMLGLSQGLKPVAEVRDAVLAQDPASFRGIQLAFVVTELRPLVDALEVMRRRMHDQLANQARFVANAAHQLRTPLALLDMQTTVAERASIREEQADALAATRKTIGQTSRMLTQLLALTRAEPGGQTTIRDEVDLAEAARLVLSTLVTHAQKRDQDLGLDLDSLDSSTVMVHADASLLREMILNLVDNAIRYTAHGGTITVRIESGTPVRLLVIDNGPGIPETEREQVFERFYRGTGVSAEGSGLGLSIVREIVRSIDADIVLSDAEPSGLVVAVRFAGQKATR